MHTTKHSEETKAMIRATIASRGGAWNKGKGQGKSRQPSREAKKSWLERNKENRPQICRNNKLRNFFGISPEDFQKLLEAQEYRCAICKERLGDNPRDRHLDHDHSSGWIRGILCPGCNHGIGQFKEDIVRMQEAIEYLVSNATPTEFSIIAVRALLSMRYRKNEGN